LKILAVLKDVRDHSKLNKATPIISAGLNDFSPDWPTPKMKLDAVSVDATLRFMRSNGLDNLVDGYGIHRYPKDKTPEERKTLLEKACLTGRNKPTDGKPCWITEWGVNNFDRNCPPDDTIRAPIVKETMTNMRALAKQGRLVEALYYRWDSYPASFFDPTTVYRCDMLTESGKLVVSPAAKQ